MSPRPLHFNGWRKLLPANLAPDPSSSSIRKIWLYLAKRSERHGAPVLIWPVDRPTVRSAMKVSSVSPLRCEIMVPQPLALAKLCASIASVTVPIWFTFNRRPLQDFFSTAVAMRLGLVTVRSSPTIWISVEPVNLPQDSQDDSLTNFYETKLEASTACSS